MAVTVTQTNTTTASVNTKVYTIIATADADTTATITHGFGATPAVVALTPLLGQFYTSAWFASAQNASEIVLTKGTGVGSGNAGAQAQVTLSRPHTIFA